MKLTRKMVKNLKRVLVNGFLNQMNSPEGLSFIWNGETEHVDALDKRVHWMTLRDSRLADLVLPSLVEGQLQGWTRVGLASELAKRQIRDMFPGQEKFITWAWYSKVK
jgi:hypothetical protein